MKILLSTLCLNEMEWLEKLYLQHKDWPDLVRWVFVEAADTMYARANPGMVSPGGLSIDGTTEFLKELAARDPRIVHHPFGFTSSKDPATGKIRARQVAFDHAAEVEPNFVIVLDADEFYARAHQGQINRMMLKHEGWDSFIFKRREIWRPPSIADQPLFALEVRGGFWQIPCCHWWRWRPGIHHGECHNTPQDASGRYLNDRIMRFDAFPENPQMVHLGFASQAKTRLAKNEYYAVRGEARDRQRRWYVDSRSRWASWQPGDVLPRGAEVVPYDGPIPEVFQAEQA